MRGSPKYFITLRSKSQEEKYEKQYKKCTILKRIFCAIFHLEKAGFIAYNEGTNKEENTSKNERKYNYENLPAEQKR